MRSKFPGYFRPTKAEFDDIWTRGLVVPDTNVLLHLLRFRGGTRDDIIKTLKAFKAQLWLPNQVAFEFSRSWSKVDHDHRASYQALKEQIESLGDALIQLLVNVGRYQIIDAKKEKAKIDKFVKELCKSIDESSKNHPPLNNEALNYLKDIDIAKQVRLNNEALNYLKDVDIAKQVRLNNEALNYLKDVDISKQVQPSLASLNALNDSDTAKQVEPMRKLNGLAAAAETPEKVMPPKSNANAPRSQPVDSKPLKNAENDTNDENSGPQIR